MIHWFVVIAIISLLIAVNGLYVAAEFSAVSVRRPRLAQLADEGNRLAARMLAIVEEPKKLDVYVATCQLGITISSLVLGFYGQSTMTVLLEPLAARLGESAQVIAQSASATLVLLLLTALQVIFGEIVPKNISVQYPEKLVLFTAVVMDWSTALFRPLIWLFNGSGQLLLRLFGERAAAEHTHIHSPEEILMLVEESSAGGLLDAEERRLLINTLQLRNLTARKVMIPRTHIVAASLGESPLELFNLLAQSPHSRLPLYRGSIDFIVGVVHLKDLLYLHHPQRTDKEGKSVAQDIAQVMHPVLYVPDSLEVEDVMAQMQQSRRNVAIVVDEYGGTAGMITFEDLIEEIIGEFQDEFDVENPVLELRPNNRVRVRGDVLLDDLGETLELSLSSEGVDTIGGLVLKAVGKIPESGETVEIAGLTMRVDKVINNRVVTVSFPLTIQQVERIKMLSEQI